MIEVVEALLSSSEARLMPGPFIYVFGMSLSLVSGYIDHGPAYAFVYAVMLPWLLCGYFVSKFVVSWFIADNFWHVCKMFRDS